MVWKKKSDSWSILFCLEHDILENFSYCNKNKKVTIEYTLNPNVNEFKKNSKIDVWSATNRTYNSAQVGYNVLFFRKCIFFQLEH